MEISVYPLKLEETYTIQGDSYAVFATVDHRLGRLASDRDKIIYR